MRWAGDKHFSAASDDHIFLTALSKLWQRAIHDCRHETGTQNIRIMKVSVSLYHLRSIENKQRDLFMDTDSDAVKWEALAHTMDEIVAKYGSKAVSLGVWIEPPGGYAGAKIAFGRIPSMADF